MNLKRKLDNVWGLLGMTFSDCFHETKGSKLPPDWELKTLEDISELITDGSHYSPRMNYKW